MIGTKYKIDALLREALNELLEKSNFRKNTEFTLSESLKYKHKGSERTKVIIEAYNFLSKSPLHNNDYYKYFNAYVTDEVKLDPEYFKHDLKKLNGYYKKFDDKKLNPFIENKYREYVIYMYLKLTGCYKVEDDKIFNVTMRGSREYNPLTNIPSVLRGELPFKVKEYDIKQAFPTFIDIELNSNFRNKVYEALTKKEFAIALNSHKESKVSLQDARKTLGKVYTNKVEEVLNSKRYNEKGKAFNDLAKYESEYINKFVTVNNLSNFARLHDGVFVLESTNVEYTQFDKVEFAIKECITPEVINNKVLFYSFDDKGKVVLTPTAISKFLLQEKFIRIDSSDDKVQLLKNTNNVIDYFNYKTNIVSFLESKIVEVDKAKVKDAIARHNFSTIAQSYNLIPATKLEYYRDSKTGFGLPFKNEFIYFDNLDKFELKTKQYNEVKGFFTPHPVQTKNFVYTDEIGDFEKFLFRASTGAKDYEVNDINFQAICSIVGYLSTNYKKPNDNPIVVLTDEGANEENRNGRRGKSLLSLALGQVTKKKVKGDNEFDPTYRHVFADLDKSYNLYVVDDVSAGFKYNSLYTVTTGSIGVEPKCKAGFEIDFKDSPKFMITTNYIFRLNKNDASSVARFVEFKFKPYYSNSLKPEAEFKGLFFEDWDDLEWNKFYSFIYRCVFNYLKSGIIRIDYNKDEDNYKATFNDAREDLMNNILKTLTKHNKPFTVTKVLEQIRLYDWSITNDKFINVNSAKNLVNLFIASNEQYQNYKYVQRNREWSVE